jgi:hypothetical protein
VTAGESGSPGRHPVRRSWPVKDGLAKVEALAAASVFLAGALRLVPYALCLLVYIKNEIEQNLLLRINYQ